MSVSLWFIIDRSIIDVSTNGGVTMKRHAYSKIPFLLRVTNNQLNTLFSKNMKLNGSRYEILNYLMDDEKYSQSDLQKAIDIDRAAITRHLKGLEEEGYVLRERNPLDSREILVSITPKGKKDLVLCQGDTLNFCDQVFASLTDEELMNLTHYLEKMKRHLDAL